MRCAGVDSMAILRVARVNSPLANLMGEGIVIVAKWLGRSRGKVDYQLSVPEFENLQIDN